MDWQSDEIPSSIRRPWEVLEQELDDQLEDAQGVFWLSTNYSSCKSIPT